MHFDLVSLVNDGEFYVLDVEGDGESGQHPVEVSLLRYYRGRPTEEFHWMINPERPISSYVSVMHGITDEMVSDAPTFREVKADIVSHFEGNVIVAHNIRDDMRLLAPVMPEAPLLPSSMIDTFRLSRSVVKEIERHNLDTLSEALGIEVPAVRPYPVHTDYPFRGVTRHSTGVDTYLAGEAIVRMARRIDPSAKQRKHVSQMALYQMNARQQQALRDEIAAGEAPIAASGVTARV
jgi:DNA polymerase III epsilon subunit-like protein